MISNINSIQKNFINKKIYSLIIEGVKYTFLSIQLAGSLEEAFILAQKEFINKNPDSVEKMIGAKIGLFEIKEIPELFFGPNVNNMIKSLESNKQTILSRQKILQPNRKINEISEKNKLMQSIVNNDDLEKNKNLFNESEFKYLKDKIAAKETLKQKNNDSI